ncbi:MULTISPECIES: TIGR01440 family protein [unclassified Ruminococcus]|uniref:TIGR01440 family protein n=1 Tax=unclassified Ruminococcus TaxID=2608920 RepID=UPI00210E7C96|nr:MULTISPECIES: TIGR01440 family protein [unclassified Ruminococcus]MCQ4021669.1 TIGR01440 family protein [Ruminococcus sp. zg-924]MCQ4114114.1 TIGR01440 family protein [Ruminococcus sp. zg-921]
MSELNEIAQQAKQAVTELLEVAKLEKNDIVVVGCSSSEIIGSKLGTNSSIEVASVVFDAIYEIVKENGLFLATQCCEHLNRALIIENECAKLYGYEKVNVIPQPKAGGSFSTRAYERFGHPVAVQEIKASAGIDIGDVLIGMHLKRTAVPVRISINKIGHAHLVCARTRPPFIGGVRAKYDEDLL